MTPLYIAGPCVIETEEQCRTIANEIKRLNASLKTNIIFKASFDKANRTSFQSYRGPGIEAGLEILSNIKKSLGLNITTDIHETWQADKIAEVADVIQIPAFLCRQTDLIRAASETGKIVNIKKGQFMSGDDMKFAAEKTRHFGCREVWLTERGNSFGYNNLIVDFRNISIMKEFADRVIMDCTHCVQRPNANNGKSGGDRQYILPFALAAKAFSADGFFFEVHPKPEEALSDGANSLELNDLEKYLTELN